MIIYTPQSEYNSMRNRIGGVVRYNHHIYTYSDRFGVGAGNREMASAAAVVRNWSVYFYAILHK